MTECDVALWTRAIPSRQATEAAPDAAPMAAPPARAD
jgi:hypothetical protein